MTPRGLRLNNPGNLRLSSGIPWQGEVPGTDLEFVTFSSMTMGIRAMARCLLTYQTAHGLNTIAEIIPRWAPPSENSTAAYIAAVAAYMGVPADAPLSLTDPAVLGRLVMAICIQEEGASAAVAAIPASTLSAGVNLALNLPEE